MYIARPALTSDSPCHDPAVRSPSQSTTFQIPSAQSGSETDRSADGVSPAHQRSVFTFHPSTITQPLQLTAPFNKIPLLLSHLFHRYILNEIGTLLRYFAT